MRFGMVTTFYPPFSYGGDATYVRNLAKALVEQGHDVDVIASTEAYLVRSKDGDQVEPTGKTESKFGIRHRSGIARAARQSADRTSGASHDRR